jgi:hypothetical protein
MTPGQVTQVLFDQAGLGRGKVGGVLLIVQMMLTS